MEVQLLSFCDLKIIIIIGYLELKKLSTNAAKLVCLAENITIKYDTIFVHLMKFAQIHFPSSA